MSTPHGPNVAAATGASPNVASGPSRRNIGRNVRASTRSNLLASGGKTTTPDVNVPPPPPDDDDDGEPLMKRLARREAEKKVEELAATGEDDAQSYFTALKRINDERPFLDKMASQQRPPPPPAERFPEGGEAPFRSAPSFRREASVQGGTRPLLPMGSKDLGSAKKGHTARKPWRSMSLRERSFHVGVRVFAVVNALAIVYFGYLAFGLFRSDNQMDPTAWRLAFGITAVMIAFQMLQMYYDYIRLFNIWLILTMLLLVGLFYGAIRFFLNVYGRDFPCFRGFTVGNEEFSMCREGRLLIALTSATLYLTSLSFFTWRWKRFRKFEKQRKGEMEEDLDMNVILSGVDELQREARGVTKNVIAPPEEANRHLYGEFDEPEMYDNPMAASTPAARGPSRIMRPSMGAAPAITPGPQSVTSQRTPSTVAPNSLRSNSLIAQNSGVAPYDSPVIPPSKIALPYQAPTPPVKEMKRLN